MSDWAKPMAVKPLDQVKACRRLGHMPRRIEVLAAEARLDAAWRQDQAAHDTNFAALEHNVTMRRRITELMTQCGVPDHFYAAKSDRPVFGRLPKKVKQEAGYLGDLKRTFPISDGFAEVQRLYEMLAKEIAEAKAAIEKARAAVEEGRKQDADRRKAELVLAAIKVRHGIADDVDWDGTLEALREKDKYLDLGIAGVQTRGDWSEGGWRVDGALKRFTIETNQDKDIAADLCGCLRALSEGDTDGRTFRDTEWNYDKLFGLVADKQLLADAQTCLANMREPS